MIHHPAMLVLEDGTVFKGIAFGYISKSPIFSVGEVVFNTSISGYQEIITDPSYAEQIITLTYPQIGNVGINFDDHESNQIYAKGLIIRKLPLQTSNWRAATTLAQFLSQQKILGLANIDTRHLTRCLREKGAMNGCIVSAPYIDEGLIEIALNKAKQFLGLEGLNLAKVVSTPTPYLWNEGGNWGSPKPPQLLRPYHVVAIDFGIKKTILRILHDLGCQISVVPYHTPIADILDLQPDGLFLSNGPGDPQACTDLIERLKQWMNAKIPIFGICLGFQLLGLALGAKTMKMKFGHHGGNHPVQCEKTQRVFITSQNHGFAIDEQTLPESLSVTHRSLFDHTLQGIMHKTLPFYGFQGHPEAGPGPNDARILFQDFIQAMKSYQKTKQPLSLNIATE